MKRYLQQLPSFVIRIVALCFGWANHLKRDVEVMSPPTALRCRSLLVALCTCLVVLPAMSHAQQQDTAKQTPPIPKLATTIQDPLPVYPGSQFRQQSSVEDYPARVKVVVDEYVTAEAPEKVSAFYRKELAARGAVIECRSMRVFTSGKFSKGCKADKGDTLQLKFIGKKQQYVVAVKASAGTTEFALVYLSNLPASAVPPKLAVLEHNPSTSEYPASAAPDNDEPHPQHPGGFSFADPGAPPAGSREPPGLKDP